MALILFGVLFLGVSDTQLVPPLLASIASEFHVSAGHTGIIVTSYSLAAAVFALFAGPLSDQNRSQESARRRARSIYSCVVFNLTRYHTWRARHRPDVYRICRRNAVDVRAIVRRRSLLVRPARTRHGRAFDGLLPRFRYQRSGGGLDGARVGMAIGLRMPRRACELLCSFSRCGSCRQSEKRNAPRTRCFRTSICILRSPTDWPEWPRHF